MILHIAICEDEEKTAFQVEDLLIKTCKQLGIKLETEVYFSGESLCKVLTSGTCFEIIFLDIELPKINGVQVGKIIRDKLKDELTQIVYISAKPDYALELFENNPLNFLLKPINGQMIEKVMQKFLKLAGFWSDVFTYKYGHDTFKVKIKDILYLESMGKKIIIHLRNEKSEEFYGSIGSVFEEQLKKFDFLFIHKSYVVNYDHIAVFEYEQIELTDKTTLPISRPKRKKIRELQSEIEVRRR
ncbi:MAG: LytTR family DNA-binding domain-containing protein [Lachnospiraceae bacterium]|nr:LytTR family DNA-binding domain-containing protein [Lachnospiraceae bacterium]